jgi:hypothetical protein
METRRKEVLLAYSSGKLDAVDVPPLEGHLESCPGCREFVQAQRAVWDALDVWEPAPVSPDFNRRLYQRLEPQASWRDRVARLFQPFGLGRMIPIAASAAVVLMAALLIQRAPAPLDTAQHETAQVETVQPEQLVMALDEMEALSQLSRPVHADNTDSKM